MSKSPVELAAYQSWSEAGDLLVRVQLRGPGEESRRGRLAPGHLADFVVLDRDITTSTPEQIATTTVLATIRGGHATYNTGLGMP